MDMNRSCSPCGRTASLVACPDCGREVSYRARHCVHCGRPYPGGCPMGKAGVILAIVAIGFGGLIGVQAAKRHRTAPTSCSVAVMPCGHEGDWNQSLSHRASGVGFLGIHCDDTTGVQWVGDDSPAERIGIEAGDRIVKIDGTDIGCFHDILGAIWKHKPGDKVKVEARRGSEKRIFEVELGKLPRD